MAVNSIFRSEILYKAPIESNQALDKGIIETIEDGIDAIVEYPGSRKGDFGEWNLVDWMDGKIQQIVGKSGTERR